MSKPKVPPAEAERAQPQEGDPTGAPVLDLSGDAGVVWQPWGPGALRRRMRPKPECWMPVRRRGWEETRVFKARGDGVAEGRGSWVEVGQEAYWAASCLFGVLLPSTDAHRSSDPFFLPLWPLVAG